MAGIPGPYPKRSDQVHGHGYQKKKEEKLTRGQLELGEKLGPEAPAWLHQSQLALNWYEALRISGTAVFYTPADWQAALFVARNLIDAANWPSASKLDAIMRAMGQLLVTEGERRRVRIELERGESSDPDDEAATEHQREMMERLGVPDIEAKRAAKAAGGDGGS